jgi:hypothetical protein
MRQDDRIVLYITEPAQEGRSEQNMCLTPLTNPLVLTGRYIKTWADFRGSQFTGDEDSVGLLAIQPPDVAASPRILLNLVYVKALNYISITFI